MVLEHLGSGGFGAVYRVRHAQLGAIRALKVLHDDRVTSANQFLQEARLQSEVQSDFVVQVMDFFEHEGRCALVMEYIEGCRLSDWIQARCLALQEALEVFHQIVEGVDAIHGAGIVHRDLKPANILMTLTPSGWRPKVTDFGVSTVCRPSEGAEESLGGTPLYMAPEQLAGEAGVDHRADLFALGCILHELVFGESAYRSSALRVGEQGRQRSASPLRSSSEQQAHVCALIERLLEEEPDARLSSVAELREALTMPRSEPPSENVPVMRGSARTPWTHGAFVLGLSLLSLTPAWWSVLDVPTRWLGNLSASSSADSFQHLGRVTLLNAPAAEEGDNDRALIKQLLEECARQGPAAILLNVPMDYPADGADALRAAALSSPSPPVIMGARDWAGALEVDPVSLAAQNLHFGTSRFGADARQGFRLFGDLQRGDSEAVVARDVTQAARILMDGQDVRVFGDAEEPGSVWSMLFVPAAFAQSGEVPGLVETASAQEACRPGCLVILSFDDWDTRSERAPWVEVRVQGSTEDGADVRAGVENVRAPRLIAAQILSLLEGNALSRRWRTPLDVATSALLGVRSPVQRAHYLVSSRAPGLPGALVQLGLLLTVSLGATRWTHARTRRKRRFMLARASLYFAVLTAFVAALSGVLLPFTATVVALWGSVMLKRRGIR